MRRCSCPKDRHLECGCKINARGCTRISCNKHYNIARNWINEIKRRTE